MKFTIRITAILAVTFTFWYAKAQTFTDGLMMNPKETCIAIMYERGSWDRYWEGSFLRSNGNMGTVYRNVAMPMIAVGIHQKLNFLIATPYVKTESSWPNGGQMAGVQGFQDLNVGIKATAFDKQFTNDRLTVFVVGAYATPLTNYLADYQPYSLGMGTTEVSGRVIAQYETADGLYVRSSLAYLWRGYTEAERDFYFADGVAYYTPWMDVPNAWNHQTAIGMWLLDKSLRVEGTYTTLRCLTGDDIRKQNSPQPTNKVEVDQIGFFGQYYLKPVKGLGVLGYYNLMTDGRNMGKFSTGGIGITYQFQL